MAEGAQNVKVAIRCRPLSQKELAEPTIVEMIEDYSASAETQGQVVLNDPAEAEEPAKFGFDIVFGLAVLQSQVYEAVGKPALQKTFEGYNGTIFAYGQTGSGKRFSMQGATGDLRGITPRINETLFEQIAEMSANSSRRYLVMCSYFEIYNEIIFDLQNPPSDKGKLGGGLQIKEHPVMGIYVKDLTEIVSDSAEKLQDVLDAGMKTRAVSATQMNSTSSRSHSVFTIKVHQKDEEDTSKNVFAKLNLVDLAGSERQKGTGATGQTLKEGANINKSLSALGNVINALVESANGKKVFIPYRNSKLTRVLQESLGGNSLCTMLATLSPAACNYEETMSTLRYANRAKAIKVSATKNEEASQISRLKAEVDELKKKLLGNAATGGGGGKGMGLTDAEREEEKEKCEKQLKEMEKMMSSNWEMKAKLSEDHKNKMQQIKDEKKRAQQALQEERTRRLHMLQEKNDLELSIRGLIDFVLAMPKLEGMPAALTGEQPRQWLKWRSALRLLVDELKEHRTMVLVFKHAFDEDVRLWGEGVESSDIGIAATGISRCLSKLDKLRKGSEKLANLEMQSLASATELADSIKQAVVDVANFRSEHEQEGADGQAAEDVDKVDSQKHSLEEVSRVLLLVEQQAQQMVEEIEKMAVLEMANTCDLVLQHTQSFSSAASPSLEDDTLPVLCDNLRTLVSEPQLALLWSAGLRRSPLRDYTAEDAGDTAETTKVLLGQLIKWADFCGGKTRKTAEELLARPPPKFLLDVTLAVKRSTGFAPITEEDWPETREGRLQKFASIAHAISSALSTQIDFEPEDVLKGKEVPKTLRLLQLLGIAAAKTLPVIEVCKRGLARPGELAAMLDTMMRCVEGAKLRVQAQLNADSEARSGEQDLTAKIQLAEQELEETTRNRTRQHEAVVEAERQIQELEVELKKASAESEQLREHVVVDEQEVSEQRQLQELQVNMASPAEIPEEAILRLLAAQLEEVRKALSLDDIANSELERQQEEIQSDIKEVQCQAQELEAEVQRERQRHDMEDELKGASPEEQLVILQAHEQKLKARAESLEDAIAQMQTAAEERKEKISRVLESNARLAAKAEDAQLQVQIVQEERDALRDAIEQLWAEKAIVDDELLRISEGYVDLTNRVNDKMDETQDLEDTLEKRVAEVNSIQKNGMG